MSTPNDNIYATQQPLPGETASDNATPFSEPPQYQQPHQQPFAPLGPQYHYYQQPPQRGLGCVGFMLRTALVVVALFFCMFIGMIMLSPVFMALSGGGMEQFGHTENKLTEKYVRGHKTATQKVAIITVEGVIAGGDDSFVARQIRQATEDSNIAAVVLRIESPGGTMSGSDYYHYLLKTMKAEQNIPVVVSMGTVAASGGYYIAMAGDEIYAEPSTITGSIGVIVSLYNGKGLLEKIGVESTPITSGPLKTMGSFSKPLSPEERAVWQRLVDDSFGLFKQVIRDGQQVFADDPAKLDKLATGQIFTASEAKANQLIDKIGYIDDAIAEAFTLAGVTENDTKVIRYRPKMTFAEVLLEAGGSDKMPGAAALGKTLVDVSTPKVYALCPQVLPVEGVSSER